MALGTRVASLFAELKLDDQMTPGLSGARGGLDRLGSKLTSTGQKLQGLGAKITLLTLPLAIGMGIAVKKATDFDNAMANVNTILGISGEEARQLNADILKIGGDSLAGPQKVAESFFDIVSGIEGAETQLAILDAAIATSEAGQSDLATTTAALVGVTNAFGLKAQGVARASDIMTQTVGKGVLTMDELAAALPNVTTLAAGLGIEFSEISGALALMTKGGTGAAEASTQLRQAMVALINPNETMKRALDELGFESGQAALEALGLQGALEAIAKTAVVSEEGLAKTVGGAEALNAAMVLSSDGAGDFIKNFQGILTPAQEVSAAFLVATGEADDLTEAMQLLGIGFDGATERARAIQRESPAFQFGLMKSAASEAAIAIGQKLLPFLTETGNKLIPIVESITDWVVANPELTQQILLAAGALIILGPLLGIVGTALTIIGVAVSAAAVGIGAVTAAFGLLISPIVLAALSVAGIIVILNELAKALGFAGVVEAVRAVFGEIVTVIGDAMATAGQIVALAVQTMMSLIEGVTTAIQTASDIASDIAGAPGTAIEVGGGLLEQSATIIGHFFGGNALGGPVSKGVPTFVGEGGMELFVPSSAGRIVPNNQLGRGGGSGGFQIFGPIIVQGVQDVGAMLDAIERESSMRAARAS